MGESGITHRFQWLSRTEGHVIYALLTRLPLTYIAIGPFDLHVLGTPPALVLSQDQTLQEELFPRHITHKGNVT